MALGRGLFWAKGLLCRPDSARRAVLCISAQVQGDGAGGTGVGGRMGLLDVTGRGTDGNRPSMWLSVHNKKVVAYQLLIGAFQLCVYT